MIKAQEFLAKSKPQRAAEKAAKLEEARRRCYFHVTYHPQGPSTHEIQQLFEEHVLKPVGMTPFNKLGSGDVPLDAMIVANHRPPNLGNMLSYRKICKRNGPPVSSLFDSNKLWRPIFLSIAATLASRALLAIDKKLGS